MQNSDSYSFLNAYECYSMCFHPGCTESMINGGKIVLPPTALEELTYLETPFPMLFKLQNEEADKHTHSGVLEFSAEEDKMYAPYWMMQNLGLEEGGIVTLETAELVLGTYVKFQPVTSNFYEITNQRAVLENTLRDFACLTKGDTISINYNNHSYSLNVTETKPDTAIKIIECDIEVDFDESVENCKKAEEALIAKHEIEEDDDYQKARREIKPIETYPGPGVRLDGQVKPENSAAKLIKLEKPRGIPNYEYEFGLLSFSRCTNISRQTNLPNKSEVNSQVKIIGEPVNLEEASPGSSALPDSGN